MWSSLAISRSYLFSSISYSRPRDNIWAGMLVRGERIIRTVLICVVYDSCAQWHDQSCEQFLRLRAGFGLGFVFSVPFNLDLAFCCRFVVLA